MKLNLSKAFSLGIACVLVNACSTGPRVKENNPDKLYQHACRNKKNVKGVEGSVWIQAKSKEASGQFPAQVEAKLPNRLDLEVTNLLGGTEAFIKVRKQEIDVTIPGHENQKKRGSWGGIPLRWAPHLFVGLVPCPSRDAAKRANKTVNAKHDLMIELKKNQESFLYEFKDFAGEPWPERVVWTKKLKTHEVEVEFEFSEPESKTRLAQRWEASSSLGEVSLRWKRRKLR